MWQHSFLVFTNLVAHGLLCRQVLPAKAKAFERVSAAMVVRAALCAKAADETLLFLVPGGTASTARYVTAGLLAGDYAHAHGQGHLPPEEIRPLLKGSALLVTPAASECQSELEELRLGSQRLGDIWEVLPLSRYVSRSSPKPALLLANPGWAQSGMTARRFATVVIDATHPRTLSRLPDLLNAAEATSSLRIIVAPPLAEALLGKLGVPSRADAWLWDEQAIAEAEEAVDGQPRPTVIPSPRTLWLCDSDQEANDALSEAYQCLAEATRQSAGRSYPGLRLAWSITNRLRQSTVPLTQLDHAAASTWAGGIGRAVAALASVSGHGEALWDATWPRVRGSVEVAYRVLLQRDESAKFWSLASRLEALLRDPEKSCRIVVPTVTDGELLAKSLETVVDGLSHAIAEGRLEVLTQAQEARAIAEGHQAHALLLGARPSYARYLDVFARHPIDEFLYPFEFVVEQAGLRHLYESASKLDGSARMTLLSKLGLRDPKPSLSRAPNAQAPIVLKQANGHPITLATASKVEATLDLDAIAAWSEPAEQTERDAIEATASLSARNSTVVEVSFVDGRQSRYYEGQSVDVYFTQSDQIQREPVTALQPGWQVILFVDGEYDSLFNRLAEAIAQRLPRRERASLELWEKAKSHLLAKHESKKALYRELSAAGLTSGYDVFTCWFREGEDAVMAPQQYDEFAIVAKATSVFPDETMLRDVFESVKHARGRNRSAGRKLTAFLRAIVSRDGYLDALESARRFDAALADVCAAVDVLEVASIQIVPRRQ